MSLEIYVDGSPGKKEGGWSGWGVAAYIGESCVRRMCGVARGKTTTNAMELEAFIRGIGAAVDAGMQATIWTDSQYVAHSWTGLIKLHRENFESKGKRIPNADRLELLYDLLYEFEYLSLVEMRWLKGHNKKAGNEEADRLSKLAAYQGVMQDITEEINETSTRD